MIWGYKPHHSTKNNALKAVISGLLKVLFYKGFNGIGW